MILADTSQKCDILDEKRKKKKKSELTREMVCGSWKSIPALFY